MYNPHADGTDRGIPRDAGELYACRITVALKAAPNFFRTAFFCFTD
nr:MULTISPECIES: hypothetical protein [Ruminococcus]